MKDLIYQKLKKLKKGYASEGFIILGVFGSYARGEESEESDLDILYETQDLFKSKYTGLEYFGRIFDIKEELKNEFKKEVDIADKQALNEIGKKYILSGLVQVE